MTLPSMAPAGGWSDRKLAELRTAYTDKNGWVFLGSCIAFSGEFIDAITDDSVSEETTLDEFRSCVDLTAFEEAFGYEEDTLLLKDDRYVGYYRSMIPEDHPDYPLAEVLYLDHSRIEYVWVLVKQ